MQETAAERIDYFHIELETHDIIFAEGAPAETYVDCDNRGMFHNGAEFGRRYPADTRPAWQFCATRAAPGSDELCAIRAGILARASQAGFATFDPDLCLIVDGEILRPRSIAGRVYRFAVVPGGRTLWLASRSAVPAEVEAVSPDGRRLGVAVERVVLRDADLKVEFGPESSVLCEGFHAPEPNHRWTDGMGRLRLADHSFLGEAVLEVHLADTELHYAVGPADAVVSRICRVPGALPQPAVVA
jgi:hypothetical protein